MSLTDQTVAAQVKVPQPPDVIGPITSLAQLQYMQANAARAQAETGQIGLNTQFTAGKLGALKAYNDAIASGAKPEDALGASGLAGYDPSGANAILGNVQTGMTIAGNRAYAANPTNPMSAAPGGPALVGQAATAGQTLASTAQTQANTSRIQTENFARIGTIMAADPSPAGRQQASTVAAQLGASPQLISQFMALPDDQYVNAGKHLIQASMTPEAYMTASGQTAENQGLAKASTDIQHVQPGESLVGGPGAAAVWNGQAPPSFTGRGTLGNYGPPQAAGPSLANPTGAPVTAPAPPPPGPPAPGPQPVPATPAGASAQSTGPNYYGVIAGKESGGNPNPSTGVPGGGMYQFLPGTRAGVAAAHPELGLTANWATDPAQATKGMMAFTGDNAKLLSANGIQVTDKSLRMAHFLGAPGATKFYQAAVQDPNAAAASIFPAEAKANPTLFYANGSQPRSLSQLYDVVTKGFGNGLTANVAPGAGTLGMTPGTPLAQPGGSVPQTAMAGAAPIITSNFQNGPINAPRPALAPPPVVPPAPVTPPAAPVTPPVAPVASAAPPAPTPTPPPALAPQVAGGAGASIAPGAGVLASGMSLADRAGQEALGRGMAEAQVKQFGEAKEAYQTASTAQLKLNELQHSLADLPTSGSLLTPGSGATERIGAAKYVNTLLSMAGAAPAFDPKQIAAAEASQKITGGLGFDLSRSMGAREAAQIVQQAISLNPGVQSTPQGAKVVAGAINAGLQRQKDFYQFLSQNGNKAGADIAFNKMYPVARYVQEAQSLAKIPQQAVDLIQKNPDSPTLAHYFEQHYGAGMSRYFTGQ